MKKFYKVFCVGIVIALALWGLAVTVSAQDPEGILVKNPVPPRPDLKVKLQTATDRPGVTLSAASTPEELEKAYQSYLASKLKGMSGAPLSGAGLKAAPSNDRVIVALVDFNDLTHNSIPKPSTENNTDYWVEDFNLAHYQTMLFSETNQWSLRRYFREASDYGGGDGYDLQGDIHDWTALPGNAAQYGDDDPTGGVDNDATDGYTLTDLVQDAVDTLVGWTPSGGWSAYSSSSSPPYIIDYFIIVHAGKGQEAGGGTLGDDAIWSTHGSLSSPYQIGSTGYWVQNFIVVSEDAPVGVLVHEMGHLFGLPDTWNPCSANDNEMAWPGQDTGGAGEASPSFYDPMAQGCWLGRPLGTRPASMTAWERIQLGWLSPAVWDLSMMPASIYLAQLETPSAANKALRIDLPPKTYVSPHSGDWMRGAPDPSDRTSPSELRHDFEVNGTATIQLRFWHWYDLNPAYATAYVQVDSNPSDGLNWTTVASYDGKSGGWVQETVTLGTFSSGWISVRFYLERSNVASGLGWFLDDFELLQNGVVIWSDDVESSALGPGQGSGTVSYWTDTRFPRMGALISEHYYLAEWRNDEAGFDVGLQEAYNMTDMATGRAEYFRYNPGLLIWYVNPVYPEGDNDVSWHPGEGFLLAIDAHPDALIQASTITPWRTRVQMQDATFRHSATTYQNVLTDEGGAPNTIGPLPAASYFWDRWSSYPYWDPDAPDNSAKTEQYGVRLEVEGENPDKSGATIRFSIDAGDLRESTKTVDKAVATPGEVLEYTIVLTNTGIADAHTIVVSDTAPDHTSYVMGSVNVQGSPNTVSLTEGNGFRWQGTVPLSTPVTITFQVVLDPIIDNGTIIQNVAHVYEGTVPEVDLYAETVVESQPCLTSSTKTSSPTSVLAGGVVTYTIALENTGNMNATAVVTDCIPECTSYVSGSLTYSAGSGYYDPQTDCIYWTGPVAAQVGPTTWITFQVQVDPGQIPCTLITNQAMLYDGYHPPFAIGANTTVLTGPNLQFSTKSVDKTVAAPGEQLDYTIYVSNVGNQPATVAISDLIPANTTYVAGSLQCSGSAGGSCSYTGAGVSYAGTLDILTEETIQFSVIISSPLANGTIITNTASILENGTNYYTRTVTTTVLSEPRLTNSTKEVASNSVGYGGILTYTITLLNDGTQNATVHLTDTIPWGTEYRSGSLSWTPGVGSGSYDSGLDAILWSGPITAGESVTVTFEVSITLTGTGIITNVATVDDGVHDPFNLYATSYVAALQVVTPTEDIYCGDLVVVPIRVDNVADLQGFQVTTDFDPSILQVEQIQEGTWFSPAAWTIKTYNNISGTATVAATLLSQPVGMYGSGDLYYLHFRAIGDGTSPITITYSLLSNTPAPSFTAIPHNQVNGSVTVQPRSVVGRAYLQGRTDHSGAYLYYGDQLLGVTAADGSYAFCPPVGYDQNFMLRIVKDGYLYAEKLIAVNVTDTLSLNDVTLLGGDPIGSQITVVTPVTCSPQLTMTVAGPPDGKVNVLDLTFVGARFGKTSADPDWGPDPCHPDYMAYRADINEDGTVNIFDLVLVGNNFGAIAPSPWP